MIWVPGFTGHIEETHMVGIAAHVVSLGYAVMRVELYGHGKSDGEFQNHTILKWIDQMLTVVDYAAEYPTGSPILLYSGNYTEQAGEVYGTSLGSHPEYGDSIREVNARQFVEAWNGTVIPPNSTSSGKDYVYFESATDASAPGGSAAHGVCPSARALRAAVTAEGFDLPTGMTWDENAVLFGFNPARDITVTNNHDYPVMIKMWTEGEGTGMGVYGQVVRYIPQ